MPAMPFEIVILWTDWAVFFLLAAGVAYVWRVRARADLRARCTTAARVAPVRS